MDPINQHAAWFWLRNGPDMNFAKNEAIRLLRLLPTRVEPALLDMAIALGGGLHVARIKYDAVTDNATYPEEAVLLYRPQWRGSDGHLRFGVGMGQRTQAKHIDPFDINRRPFYGVWAEDPQARAVLGQRRENRDWCNWAWWESIELTPSGTDEDFLLWYANLAAREVHRTWLDCSEAIDGVAEQATS